MGVDLLDKIMQFNDAKENFRADKKKKVGDYILGRTLGEGTFAKVRLGVHILTKEKVAIKIINKNVIKKHSYMKKHYRREAALMQKLSHENIVRLYDVMETETSYYIVMEYADGGEFIKHLTEKRLLTENEARVYMRQLVSAVDHMHRTGVVHRDLKIDNILLDKRKNVKIIDFGLSNQAHSQAILTTQCGTPGYAAPEIFSKRNYGEGVDLWTLGVDMYVMLTGSLPFVVDPPVNLTKLHAQILKGADIPRHLSPTCQDLLRRLLDPHEDTRIKMPQVFVHPWINETFLSAPPRTLPATTITLDELDEDILAYMADVLHLDESETRTNVMNRRVNGVTAIYQLMRKRLEKGFAYPGEGRKRQKKPADSKPKVEDKNGADENDVEETLPTPRHEVSVTIRFKNPVAETNLTDATDRVWNDSYGSGTRISTRAIYDTVKGEDVADEPSTLPVRHKVVPKTSRSDEEKTEYKDYLQKLRVKSRESMTSPPTSKCTNHKSDGLSQSSNENPTSSTGLQGFLQRSSTGLNPYRDVRHGPVRAQNQQRAGSSNVISPVGDAETMKKALTFSPIKPVSQTEHKQRAMEILRKDREAGHVCLPPPPPNSAMGGYIYDMGDSDRGIVGEDNNGCIACRNMERLEKEFYGKFNLRLQSKSSGDLASIRHVATCKTVNSPRVKNTDGLTPRGELPPICRKPWHRPSNTNPITVTLLNSDR